MSLLPPFNLRAWIEQYRPLLRPPVGNKLLYEDGDLIVMAVGGPNSRKDYHHDPGAEFFHQLEGDIVLKTIQGGRFTDVPIRQGEVFLLPPEVPHSPQRPAGSIGIVVERRRRAGELDGFSWYCEKCANRLYLERIAVDNLEKQLPGIFARFFSSIEHRTCKVCGTVLEPPADAQGRSSAT
ncbi:MAG TPA: 3-hydroxyanthranilate 3,4-dioxygenase [Steroidobacteraceae bacterium]|nr:3-hydroxyanthranilate 3,4-dioxygenase [Steroidobacteraceae bacterium]